MFRIWGKLFRDTHLWKDLVYENADTSIRRTAKVFDSLHYFCYELDLSEPLWLSKNIEEFKRTDRTRFYQDNFMEQIEFDYFEIHVIEED